MTCGRHVDAGVYALGAMDDAEATAFEQHLATCERCSAELDSLMDVEAVLAEFSADLADHEAVREILTPPGPALLERAVEEVRSAARAKRRRRMFLVAAAVALIVAGPLVTLGVTGSPGHGDARPSQTVSAAGADGVRAKVLITDTSWGTNLSVVLSGVHGPLTCELVAVGRDGSRQTASTWSVGDEAYGGPGHPGQFTVWGATGFSRAQIDHFDVRTLDGRTLVRVPV
jgi:hypothetical protein